MDRRELYYEAMLRELGAAYYQAVHGQGSAANVASAVQAVEKADTETAGRPGDSGPAAAGGPAHRTRLWRVRDVMTAPALSVTERTTYKQVARLLSEHRLSALPVLSRGGRVIGVVSEADLLHKQERHHSGRTGGMTWRVHRKAAAKAEAQNAGQLMTSPAVIIHPDAPVGSAARLLNGHHLRRLPVVDPDGQLLGVVSRRDLLCVFLRPDEQIAAEVRAALADPATVEVRVGQGVVRLAGQVAEAGQVPMATDLITAIDGVVAVHNELIVNSGQGG